MDDMALSNQAKQWIAKALQSSARSSRKIVEAEAHSLCKKESNRKQFQYGRYNGYRVLNYAARMGCQLLFDLLTKKLMVDPNIPDSVDGTTPLHHAAAGWQIQMIESLIEKYACDMDVGDKGGTTPLCFAIVSDQVYSLRKLLEYDVSIEVESFFGQPIHIAIFGGNVEAIKAVNTELYGFCTPLVAAALYPSIDCFKYLVEVADVKAKPLMHKVICCAETEEAAMERVQILLDHGVDPNSSYDAAILFEDRPIFCAAKRGWKNVVGSLLKSTNEVPGVDWTVEGVIQYVHTDYYIDTIESFRKKSRVYHLKERLLKEIRLNKCLAADLICKVLYVDMDRDEWDLYDSLCKFSISAGFKSIYTLGVAPTIEYLGFVAKRAGACVVLEPDNEIYKNQLEEAKAGL